MAGIPLGLARESQATSADDEVNVDVPLQVAAEGMQNGGDCWKEAVLLAEGEKRLRRCSKNGIQQDALLEKQSAKLGRNGAGNVEIGAVGEQPVDIRHPTVHLDLGTDSAESTFARVRDMAGFSWMIRSSVGVEPEAVGFSAVHDFPDVESHVPSDLFPMDDEKRIPVLLEDLFEGEAACFGDCFHDGLG